jgi:hypothetical protein
MGILLDQQALKIIFVGLTENAYCNSRKKAMGWLPRSGLVLQPLFSDPAQSSGLSLCI